MFVAGLALFSAASLAGGLATNETQLIIARAAPICALPTCCAVSPRIVSCSNTASESQLCSSPTRASPLASHNSRLCFTMICESFPASFAQLETSPLKEAKPI